MRGLVCTTRALRSSDQHEIVHAQALSAARGTIESLAAARGMDLGSVFSILLDSDGVPVQALTRGESLVCHALRAPDWDAELFLALLGPDYPGVLARLVASGALIPEHTHDHSDKVPSAHPLSELAQRAIQFGYRHTTLDGAALARRLYIYNTVPISTHRVTRFLDTNDLLQWLAGSSIHGQQLVKGATQLNHDWIRFSSRSRRGLRHKLYVSPTLDGLPRAFQTLGDEFARRPSLDFALKIAATPIGLGRPDKLVVHLAGLEDVRRLGEVLADGLSTLTPHGVPFTAPLTGTGVLSWGWDPPHRDGLPQSWRQWLTDEVAALLMQLRGRALAAPDVWPRLAAALRPLDIDPVTWTSTAAYAS